MSGAGDATSAVRRSIGSVPLAAWWLGAVGCFVALTLYPVSDRWTRAGGLALGLASWFGFVALTWSRRGVRVALLAITAMVGGFLTLPARSDRDVATLRADYVRRLSRYENVPYVWGGESVRGIDCSGLTRCGLIDSLVSRGVRTLDAGLVREGLSLWWNDCTARTLGDPAGGVTVAIVETTSLRELETSMLNPGDLAVTRNGIHVLAYVGDDRWISADPEAGRVILESASSTPSRWFRMPMRIVRWNVLR